MTTDGTTADTTHYPRSRAHDALHRAEKRARTADAATHALIGIGWAILTATQAEEETE